MMTCGLALPFKRSEEEELAYLFIYVQLKHQWAALTRQPAHIKKVLALE